jgi:parallel beta-helix repeat protein
MRIRLIILFLLLSLSLQAEKHYVAIGGGGAGTLVSPFANLTQVNAHTFVLGDSLLFNKGDSFYGTLTMDASGTTSNPIYIGSYGTGAMPIITGFSTLGSWTDNGDGNYWATVTGAEAQTNMVTIDGVVTAMGRYPNSGTNRNYESHNGTISITDNQTLSADTNWTGADILINKHYFILERSVISSHVGGVLSYTNYFGSVYSDIQDGRYFFIQNDIRCLNATNEWYHDYAAGRLYVYGDPSAKEVKIATVNYLIDTQTNSHDITIEGIHLSGSIRAAINIGNEMGQYGNNTNIIIQNCTIEHAGLQGISARMNNVSAANCLIDGNIIRYCNADAVYAYGNGFIITNNDISYIGVVPGFAFRGTDTEGIHATAVTGIESIYTIEYNNIEYTGYNGIGLYFSTINANVNHNFINYAMQVIDDGGGVYGGGASSYQRLVEHNIILNTGVGNSSAVIARGIYFDNGADDATIRYNTVAHTTGSGILIHSSNNCIVTNNLCYDNGSSVVACGGLHLLKYVNPITGTIVNNNQIIARTPTQRTLISNHTSGEIQNHGTFDYNYYARPISDAASLYYLSAYRSLSDWQTLTSQDAHSASSPTVVESIAQLHFVYNATQISTYYDLSGPMIDVIGTSYSGQTTLLPYTGLVLIGNGTVTEHVFGGSGTVFAKDANGDFIKDTNGNFIKIINE